MIQSFLLGVLTAMFFVAALFFLRYFRETGDTFFVAFSAAFFIEGISRAAALFFDHPNEGSPWIYVIRLLASLLIIGAILKKNYG